MNLKSNQLAIKLFLPSILAVGIGGLLISSSVNDNKRSQANNILNINQDFISEMPLCKAYFCEVAHFTEKKIIKTANSHRALQASLDEKNHLETISFRELIQCLPKSPRGWTTEKPYGQTSSFGENAISQARQSYFRDNKTITVSIFDWKFNSALHIPFLISTEFSQESTEGYSKGIKIDNIPGRKNYDYSTKKGGLYMLINSRFFVHINGSNIEEKELIEWWNFLNYQFLLNVE